MPYMFMGVDVAEAAKIGGSVLVVGGAVYASARQTLDRYLNREFDSWLISVTTASAIDAVTGKRRLLLDNLGSPERFDDAVRGREERKWMSEAANQCHWDVKRRFLLANPKKMAGILHVSRNAITKHYVPGVRAMMAGRKVTTHEYYFAVTGSDAAESAKKKYRVPLMTKETMDILLSHPVDMWEFDDENHKVRLETARAIATAHRNSGVHIVDDVGYTIVGWLRVYEPV